MKIVIIWVITNTRLFSGFLKMRGTLSGCFGGSKGQCSDTAVNLYLTGTGCCLRTIMTWKCLWFT